MTPRSAYNYDRDRVSDKNGLSFDDDPGRTKQQFKEDADINTIVRRFGLTGKVPANIRMPLQEDFVDATDYHTALNLMIDAQREFMKVPSDLRARFMNDPGQLMSFLADEKNRDEAVKLGLIPKPPEVTRTGTPVAPEVKAE